MCPEPTPPALPRGTGDAKSVFFPLSLPVANNNDVRLFSQAPEHLPG